MTDARFSYAQIGYRDKEKELETQGHLNEDRDHCRGGRKRNRSGSLLYWHKPSNARHVIAARQKYISALSRTGHFYYLSLA